MKCTHGRNCFHGGYVRAYPIWTAANVPIGQLVGCAENNRRLATKSFNVQELSIK